MFGIKKVVCEEIQKLKEEIKKEMIKNNEEIKEEIKKLNDKIEWFEFRLDSLQSNFKVFSLQNRGKIRDLSRHAIPDTTGINSTRAKWTDKSLF